ncbi:hypothetical protein [Papillibacter cinnamivorans]|uniref:PH domain-containing protein n=1 Tax=Papillibacter cinnamivorans DSM 12816 TaxID=1122930 RepID=A0A1W2BV71_9FIRM|nr:hypothetical protein [Papillibacter cinnamivorans]SMC76634.1 hypothetical protein SAMN02745168_2396 [Papillibacter cinnamivorans DSM 12816]
MPESVLDQDEFVILESQTNLMTSTWTGKVGVLKLTNKRIVFFQKNVALKVLAGALSNLSKGKAILDIPLSSISGVSRRKIQFDNNILCVHTKDGNEYLFTLRFEKWLDAIKNSMGRYSNAEIIQKSATDWAVVKKA